MENTKATYTHHALLHRKKRICFSKIAFAVFRRIILITFILITLIPFLWGLSTSLRPADQIVQYPPKLLPERWTIENYVKVVDADRYAEMTDSPAKVVRTTYYLDYFKNSVVVTVLSVALTMLVSTFAGYAASRYDFRGKNTLMFLILSGMAIGRFTNAMPLYFFSIKTNLYDTVWILVLSYAAFISPLITWLMRSYFDTIPRAIEEAAKIDGCSMWKAFCSVVMPVMTPAVIAGTIISLSYAWNEFILAMVLTKNMRTLPVNLYLFITDMGVEWGSLTAAAFLSIVPILIIFFALQKYFIQGLTAGTNTGM